MKVRFNFMRLLSIIISVLLISSCIKEDRQGADLKAGDVIPDFTLVMNDGSIVTDDDLKENVSVVMFFHTSCSDCQQALPVMQQIYDGYASNGVRFALISREEDKRTIDAFWKENGLDMPYSAQSSRKVYRLFAKERIPRIYVNEKGGIIRHMFTDDPVPTYDNLKDCLENVIR